MVHEAGCIEQDVGLAGAFCDSSDGGAVADVEPCDLGHALIPERGNSGFIDIGGKHGGTFARKSQRTGAADACGRRRHKCAFAFQAV